MNPANANPHWGYQGPVPQPQWPTHRTNKRQLSESECDDVFSEDNNKDCSSPGNTDSCQMLSRKKRRGVIEKKRRDRINTSLLELKRLVPSAFEKQGSAKLEKAEILQMTVDHLKMIHAKGLDTLACDPHKFAMDYHNIGFRECASEVARYLVTIEGMDIQDPLRLRLMSHLQCFVTQRELASKQAPVPWGYGTSPQNYSTPLNPIPVSPSAPLVQNLSHHVSVQDMSYDISTSCAQSSVSAVPTNSDVSPRLPSSTVVLTPLTPVSSSAVSTTASSAFQYHQYTNTFAPSNQQQGYNQGHNSAQMKPYRPWGGAEVAY